MKKLRVLIAVVIILALVAWSGRDGAFILGGGMAAFGQRLQELSPGFHGETPQAIVEDVLRTNRLSSIVRWAVPGAKRKPEVIAIMCMDPRLKESFILGDLRQLFDVLRVPGSVLSEEMIEAIELAVKEHKVKVLLFLTHTDCAMEKVTHSDHAHEFPALSEAVKSREERFRQLMARPAISEAVRSGALVIERRVIDTATGKLMELPS